MPGSMPFLHRFVGNPILTAILNLFFGGCVSDAHCGLRAFNKDMIEKLGIHSTGMEFASEMLIKALIGKFKIAEVPIRYSASYKGRRPHLRTFRDGWRHLRFMLVYSPNFIFTIPGSLLFITGVVMLTGITMGRVSMFSKPLGLSTMIFSQASMFVGLQLIFLGFSAKILGHAQGLIPRSSGIIFFMERFTLEKGLILGVIIFFIGLVSCFFVVLKLSSLPNYGPVNMVLTKSAIISETIVLLGVQLMASAFYISFLDIKATLE